MVGVFGAFGGKAGLVEEGPHALLDQFEPNHAVALCGQPVHVEGFAAQRNEHFAALGGVDGGPVLDHLVVMNGTMPADLFGLPPVLPERHAWAYVTRLMNPCAEASERKV